MASGGSSHRVLGRKEPVDTLLGPFRRFARFEAAGGVLLLIASVVALVWANSGNAQSYIDLWEHTTFTLKLGDFEPMGKHPTLVYWINDLLMAVFFLLVGMEIKREVLVGELSTLRRAALPIVGALGGMVGPAAVYALVNMGEGGAMHGWGVPMATDIAFALAFLSVLGRRVPLGLRVFLASLAIADDLGALLVIAIFYTEKLQFGALGIGGVVFGILILLNMLGFRRPIVYALFGLMLWYFIFLSGIHATIAGVLLALTIPARARVDASEFVAVSREMSQQFEEAGHSGKSIITNAEQQAAVQVMEDACDKVQTPLGQIEHALLPWVSFLIVPLFALANAGVAFAGGGRPVFESKITLGVVLGLLIGKPLGITLFSVVAVKLRLGELPTGVTWRHIHGASWLGGIGFTMALFIAQLAFKDPQRLAEAKVGILSASAVAAVIGMAILWGAKSAVDPERDVHPGRESGREPSPGV